MLNAQQDRNVLPVANLKEFFKDSLDETLAAQKLAIDDHTAHYIVNLLVLYARSDALFEKTPDGMRVKPLVVMLAEALEARSAEDRRRGLQRLGDVSLFISGFFARSFARKLIDIDYHIAMGGRAYATLSAAVARTRLNVLSNVFAELSDKFQPIVDVLNELSEGGAAHSDADVLRLYEIWLKTGSRRSFGLLRRLGITPSPGAHVAGAHEGPHEQALSVLLNRLQTLLGGIYDVRVGHDIYDFLVTDRSRLPAAAGSRGADEELLVDDGGGECAISLYIDPAVLARLQTADPLRELHSGNVGDFWTALEGVSHFQYLAWNARHDKPVSLHELELQAEVDKYVSSFWMMRRQSPRRFPAELVRTLFGRTRVDPALAGDRASLYRAAAHHAGIFCRSLERSLRNAQSEQGGQRVLATLRRFYRWGDARKLAHIQGL